MSTTKNPINWRQILQFIITVLTAIAGSLGCSIAFLN